MSPQPLRRQQKSRPERDILSEKTCLEAVPLGQVPVPPLSRKRIDAEPLRDQIRTACQEVAEILEAHFDDRRTRPPFSPGWGARQLAGAVSTAGAYARQTHSAPFPKVAPGP